MIRKLLIILCSTILAHAGIIGTDYSPATAVSYSSFSSGKVLTNTVKAPIGEEAVAQEIVYERPELHPIYDSVLNTQENKYRTVDGSDHRTFSKTLDNEDLNISKFEAHTTHGTSSDLTFSCPFYTEAIYQSGSYNQDSVSPILQTLSAPFKSSIDYAAPAKPVAYVLEPVKSPPTYSIKGSSIIYNTKVTPGLSAYASPPVHYAPSFIKAQSSEDQVKTVTYSEAPVVSGARVTFSGLGHSYSW